MKQIVAASYLLIVLLVACGTATQKRPTLDAEWQQHHITRLDPSRVRHSDLKTYLDALRRTGLDVREVGRSVANREIHQVSFGTGPLKVLMWSQMHGDEPTATSAVIDLLHYLQQHRHLPWVKQIEQRISVRAVPMLNPDGAELFQRRNLQFIDINRDARQLATPEGRLLKRLRDDWSPHIGFNLHNQNPRTTVGNSNRQATISLLAVASDEAGTDTPGRIRNKKLCAVIVQALKPFLANHIGRYDDSFNPRAFGDMLSRWGTPVILIETGAKRGSSEMDLVRLNFVALASGLAALADGSVEQADPKIYDALPYNTTGSLFTLIVRNAQIVNRFEAQKLPLQPFTADLAINHDERLTHQDEPRRPAFINDIGDLSIFHGLEEVDAADYYVTVPRGVLRIGAEAHLLFYQRERASRIDWSAPDVETRFPPDAVYRNGEWSGKLK